MLGFIISLLTGRKLGEKGVDRMTIGIMVIELVLYIVLFKDIIINSTIRREVLWNIIEIGGYKINLEFIYDSITVYMLLPVIIVSLMVHIYSKGYMEGSPHKIRFMSYLTMFTMFMIILVTGGNLLILFIGWEGVGISSFLLISYWHTRIEAQKSAILAIILNRIGDWTLTITIGIIIILIGSLDLSLLRIVEGPKDELNLLIIISSMAKSAQIGLDSWLPEAMEGPTPVSALIHAATMVTAGVYLLIRSSYIIGIINNPNSILIIIGGLTSMLGGMKGLLEEDIKRIIAYSTTSQLGYMILSIGIGEYGLALFHLINHAFYKALLFLGAGSVIHYNNGNQDLRILANKKSNQPITYSSMWIGIAALSALPLVGGYFTKDIIIEISSEVKWIWIISIIGAYYTTLYSSNVIQPILINSGSIKENIKDITIIIPLIILSISTLIIGYLIKDMIIGIGTDIFNGSISSNKNIQLWIDSPEGTNITLIEKLLPTILSIIMIGSELSIYWLSLKLWIDIIIRSLGRFILNLAFIQSKDLDKGLLDWSTLTSSELISTLNNPSSKEPLNQFTHLVSKGKPTYQIGPMVVVSIIIGLLYFYI